MEPEPDRRNNIEPWSRDLTVEKFDSLRIHKHPLFKSAPGKAIRKSGIEVVGPTLTSNAISGDLGFMETTVFHLVASEEQKRYLAHLAELGPRFTNTFILAVTDTFDLWKSKVSKLEEFKELFDQFEASAKEVRITNGFHHDEELLRALLDPDVESPNELVAQFRELEEFASSEIDLPVDDTVIDGLEATELIERIEGTDVHNLASSLAVQFRKLGRLYRVCVLVLERIEKDYIGLVSGPTQIAKDAANLELRTSGADIFDQDEFNTAGISGFDIERSWELDEELSEEEDDEF